MSVPPLSGQDLDTQKHALADLDVAPNRIYTDQGFTGINRSRSGLEQALAAVREGDTLATFAEFEVDLIRMRTREGMAIALAKGKLWGKQPTQLRRMHATGDHSIRDLAAVFAVSMPTVYRTLKRPAKA